MRNSKPPRKHNPKWKDNTRTERQKKRREKLNQIAQAAGFASWSAYETDAIRKGEKMNEKIWNSTATLHREDYPTEKAYREAVKEYTQHYGYKARVEGGYKFFEFENDYRTWKNQQ